MLTHYTCKADAVVNILTHGFAWFPNRRRLATLLIPDHDFSKREPQQFGMISFTEIEPHQAKRHSEEFGYYGIVVDEAWVHKNNAQRVIYVEDIGPATDAWQNLFAIGYHDVQARIRYPDDAVWQMAFENKSVAGSIVGSNLWVSLLQIYEYMEPASVAHQREWRIVNPQPFYSLSELKAEVIHQVSPPMNWAKHMNVVTISRSAVKAIVCPSSVSCELKTMLPKGYENIEILET